MANPSGWTDMGAGHPLPVASHDVSVTVGGKSATFTFNVSQQLMSTRSLLTVAIDQDTFGLSYLVVDTTDYSGSSNPKTTFGSGFTTALITAIRKLLAETTTAIPKPGDVVSYGRPGGSIVESVTINPISDTIGDAFEVTCTFQRPESGSSVERTKAPKTARSEEVPPWQEEAKMSFTANVTQGATFGYAYPTKDIDGNQKRDMVGLRKDGMASDNQLVVVENTANDPFTSPPMFSRVEGTLRIDKAFLRGFGEVTIEQGSVNKDRIDLVMSGARLVFEAGTLAITSYMITPQLYKQPIPWYSKTNHPLNKTYGELFYGYSGATSNKVATNSSGGTIVVYKPVYYLQVSTTLTYRPEGFGVWVANRGYEELKDGKRKRIMDPKTNSTKEGWLDEKGAHTESKRIQRGYTMYKPGEDVVKLLRMFFREENLSKEFSWATKEDNFGKEL